MSTKTPMNSKQSNAVASEYNPFMCPHRDNPYPLYARAREETPVFYSSELNLWVVTRYEDISRILKDSAHFSSTVVLQPRPAFNHAVLEVLKGGYPNIFNMVNNDPPDHDRLRRLLSAVFNTKSLAKMELRIRKMSNTLVDTFVNDGRADLILQYFKLLPIIVISDLIGLPHTDIVRIQQWCDDIIELLWTPMPLDKKLACARNVVALQNYLANAVEERRAVPLDDMLTDLVNTSLDNEMSLATSEIVNLVTLLLFASNEMLNRFLGTTFMLLLSHPAQLQAVRDNLSLADKVVEEAIRMEPALKGLLRTTTQAVKIGEVTVPAKEILLLSLASANHDPTSFSDAEHFDIDRVNLGHEHKHQHLGFGLGIHRCAGAPLAKLVGQIVIQVLLQRLPNLRLQADQTLEFEPSLQLRGLKHLLVEWNIAVTVGS